MDNISFRELYAKDKMERVSANTSLKFSAIDGLEKKSGPLPKSIFKKMINSALLHIVNLYGLLRHGRKIVNIRRNIDRVIIGTVDGLFHLKTMMGAVIQLKSFPVSMNYLLNRTIKSNDQGDVSCGYLDREKDPPKVDDIFKQALKLTEDDSEKYAMSIVYAMQISTQITRDEIMLLSSSFDININEIKLNLSSKTKFSAVEDEVKKKFSELKFEVNRFVNNPSFLNKERLYYFFVKNPGSALIFNSIFSSFSKDKLVSAQGSKEAKQRLEVKRCLVADSYDIVDKRLETIPGLRQSPMTKLDSTPVIEQKGSIKIEPISIYFDSDEPVKEGEESSMELALAENLLRRSSNIFKDKKMNMILDQVVDEQHFDKYIIEVNDIKDSISIGAAFKKLLGEVFGYIVNAFVGIATMATQSEGAVERLFRSLIVRKTTSKSIVRKVDRSLLWSREFVDRKTGKSEGISIVSRLDEWRDMSKKEIMKGYTNVVGLERRSSIDDVKIVDSGIIMNPIQIAVKVSSTILDKPVNEESLSHPLIKEFYNLYGEEIKELEKDPFGGLTEFEVLRFMNENASMELDLPGEIKPDFQNVLKRIGTFIPDDITEEQLESMESAYSSWKGIDVKDGIQDLTDEFTRLFEKDIPSVLAITEEYIKIFEEKVLNIDNPPGIPEHKSKKVLAVKRSNYMGMLNTLKEYRKELKSASAPLLFGEINRRMFNKDKAVMIKVLPDIASEIFTKSINVELQKSKEEETKLKKAEFKDFKKQDID